MASRQCLLVLLLLPLSLACLVSARGADVSTESDGEGAWKKAERDLVSPWTTDPARALFWTGAGLTLATTFFGNYNDEFQGDASRERALHGSSKFFEQMGQWIPNAAYAGAFLGVGLVSDGRDRANRLGFAAGMLKATVYSALLTTALKYSVREQRPDGSDRLSFPSGHTTTAFAFSGYVWAAHGPLFGVPATLLASAVGFSRMGDNRHRLNDVLAGATIGLSYGFGIRANQGPAARAAWMLSPLFDGDGHGLQLTRSFSLK